MRNATILNQRINNKKVQRDSAIGVIETGCATSSETNNQNQNQNKSMAFLFRSSGDANACDGWEDDESGKFASRGSYISMASTTAAASPQQTMIKSADGIILVSTSTLADEEGTTTRRTTKAYRSSLSSWIMLRKERLILLFLAVVYGSLNISMRLVFARPDPPTASASSTIQGWFTVVCFLPLLRGNHREISSTNNSNSNSNSYLRPPSFWRFAIELAIINFGTQSLINMSLVATQGARASFLVQTSVVFTPVVSVALGAQKVTKRVWIACFIALAGLFVLSYSEEQKGEDFDNADADAESTSSLLAFTWGDWCCLMAALCWSLYINRLSAWGEYFDETMTQFAKNTVLAFLYTGWMLGSLVSGYINGNTNFGTTDLWIGCKTDLIAWIILFYSALGPCTLADIFQQKAQASVPAAEANVILSLEPVFTTLFGFLLLGEMPAFTELCGGGLIMIASVVASCGVV